ncbi:MAG: thioesterase family protein [Pseudomonadota bacterium]
MYPVHRVALAMWRHRNDPPLKVGQFHVSRLICTPGDIDIWMEMNNGRTLTLYDTGRFVHFRRMGIIDAMRKNKWAGTVAGVSVRYRRRVRLWDRVEMQTRLIGWDDRFSYGEQSMWVRGEATSHMLIRMAVTGADGIVPPHDLAVATGNDPESPPLPAWAANWTEAEATRPWPPERD